MTDTTQTTEQEEQAPEPIQPPKRYAYPYAPLTGNASLLAYTGKPVEIGATDDIPANASQWAPPILPDGWLAYFDGIGWVAAKDVSKLQVVDLQAAITAHLDAQFMFDVDALIAPYTKAEQASWSQQVNEAQGLIAGTNKQPVLLTALATARGIDLKTLAQSVLDKSNAYNAAYGKLLGDYQAQCDAVAAAKKVADLPAITLEMLRS